MADIACVLCGSLSGLAFLAQITQDEFMGCLLEGWFAAVMKLAQTAWNEVETLRMCRNAKQTLHIITIVVGPAAFI